jgi:hypothetical protein
MKDCNHLNKANVLLIVNFMVMKRGMIIHVLLLIHVFSFSAHIASPNDSLEWNKLVGKGYTVHYTAGDVAEAKKITNYLQSGVDHITRFFDHQFRDSFNVYIFPKRSSLDKQWQKDWGDPSFKSQCWMIASGVANRLDVLSPNAWSKEACEHNANDSTEIRKVICHELIHVFHGQHNPDHTFSYIEKLDWLVEGVATFVSGQLDEKRSQQVRQMVNDNRTPLSLDEFWKGPNKYGLSGSMIAFIDKKYGRKTVFELLKHTRKQSVLEALAVSEEQLLSEWKASFK